MRASIKYQLQSWIPELHPQVRILGIGRFLSQLGTGFTLFYASIFYVNQLGFSATTVGLALGSASLSGVVGRIMAGWFCDSKFWGRRRTMLLAAAIAAIASLVLAATINLPTLIAGNLLMGLALGLYGPTTDTAISDLIPSVQSRDTYAWLRFIDNIGLEIGIVFSGVLIGITGAYRALFVINASAYLVLFWLVYLAVTETYKPQITAAKLSLKESWVKALSDRRLLVFILVNIFFTTYTAELNSILPLYLKNFVSSAQNADQGFSAITISSLFSWHVGLAILLQLPISRALKRYSQPHVMMFSALMWGLGFSVIWLMGIAPTGHLGWAVLALEILAIATICFIPPAISLVTQLAPPSQRGVYFSINSLCWAAGSFIGPMLGGWVLDRSPQLADALWLCLSSSVIVAIAILQYLQKMLNDKC